MRDRELSESALDLLLADIVVWPARVAHHSLVPTRHLATLAIVVPVGPPHRCQHSATAPHGDPRALLR